MYLIRQMAGALRTYSAKIRQIGHLRFHFSLILRRIWEKVFLIVPFHFSIVILFSLPQKMLIFSLKD